MSQAAKLLETVSTIAPRIFTGTVSPLLATAALRQYCDLQIVSDVHLEFLPKKTPLPIIHKRAENLALLGDIGKPFSDIYFQFLCAQSLKFDNVFVLMGNHEYYHVQKTVDTILKKAREVCARLENVHLLERESFDFNGQVTVLGCTLWSPLNQKASKFIRDTVCIRVNNGELLDRETYFSWHVRDVSWLQQELQKVKERNRKAVVLTHHGPLLEMSGKFQGNPYTSGFVSNLSHLFTEPAVAFASGHVHSNCDLVYNGIRSVSNAMGYPGEETGYKEDVVIRFES